MHVRTFPVLIGAPPIFRPSRTRGMSGFFDDASNWELDLDPINTTPSTGYTQDLTSLGIPVESVMSPAPSGNGIFDFFSSPQVQELALNAANSVLNSGQIRAGVPITASPTGVRTIARPGTVSSFFSSIPTAAWIAAAVGVGAFIYMRK